MTPRSWHYHADEALARERQQRPIVRAIPSDPPADELATETPGRVAFLAPDDIYREALVGTAMMPDGTRRAVYQGDLAAFLRSESLARECEQHDTCWPEDHRGEADEWVARSAHLVLVLDEEVQYSW